MIGENLINEVTTKGEIVSNTLNRARRLAHLNYVTLEAVVAHGDEHHLGWLLVEHAGMVKTVVEGNSAQIVNDTERCKISDSARVEERLSLLMGPPTGARNDTIGDWSFQILLSGLLELRQSASHKLLGSEHSLVSSVVSLNLRQYKTRATNIQLFQHHRLGVPSTCMLQTCRRSS